MLVAGVPDGGPVGGGGVPRERGVGVGSITSQVGVHVPAAARVKLSLSGGSGAPDSRDMVVGGGRNDLLVGVGVADVAGFEDMNVGLGDGFII